jgi:hypothetical protein
MSISRMLVRRPDVNGNHKTGATIANFRSEVEAILHEQKKD